LSYPDLCNIGDEEAVEFAKANWENVRFLTLNNNKIKKRGVEALARGRFLELKEFSLSDNGLDAVSVEPLAQTAWKKLEKLNLNFNYLGNQGLLGL
jgi:Ran GTPase-activating protein (RanGAP) involved in mRNA processing and transport